MAAGCREDSLSTKSGARSVRGDLDLLLSSFLFLIVFLAAKLAAFGYLDEKL